MPDPIVINIGTDFSRYPVGRYLVDGDSNGERFREELLRPKLAMGCKVRIEFDDALGYGSSFLEEVFGGLVRGGFSSQQLNSLLELITTDDSLLAEIRAYISEAEQQ